MVLPNNSLSCTGDYCSTAFCCLFVCKREILIIALLFLYIYILLKIITDFVMSVLEDVCAFVYGCVRSRGCVLIYSTDERLLLYVPSAAVWLLQ